MVDAVQIRIEGDRDLLAAFKELRNDMGPKYLMAAARRGANIMKTIIAANAPEDTGKLRRNLGIRQRKTMETVRARVVINQRGKKGDPNNAYYWSFVERGHKTRQGRKMVGPPRFVQPNPFIRRSWDTWSRNVVQMMFQAFEKTIDRAAAKQRRGAL